MALPTLRGRAAFIFAEPNFDVDLIIGVDNIKLKDPVALAACAMRSYDADFASQVRKGDFLIGGEDFGYGHPHFPAMMAMRQLGIAAVVASSFAPGYWRGEISMGFPQVPCPGILELANRWDELEIDWGNCRVTNLTRGASLSFERLSHADERMLELGGLIPYLQQTGRESPSA